MSNKIELHGWKDLNIPTESLLDLSSRAFKLYGYLIFRARTKKNAFPGQVRIAKDLTTSDETWSVPTIKRAFGELVSKNWVVRDRRVGTSSITHVFKSKSICKHFIQLRGITDDPTVGSQMIPQSDHGRSEKEYSVVKENEDNEVQDIGEKPKAPRKPDPIFDAVALRLYGIANSAQLNGANSRIAKSKKAIKEVAPEVTPEDITAFCGWYRSKYPRADLPRDGEKIKTHWLAWKQGATPTDDTADPEWSKNMKEPAI